MEVGRFATGLDKVAVIEGKPEFSVRNFSAANHGGDKIVPDRGTSSYTLSADAPSVPASQ